MAFSTDGTERYPCAVFCLKCLKTEVETFAPCSGGSLVNHPDIFFRGEISKERSFTVNIQQKVLICEKQPEDWKKAAAAI